MKARKPPARQSATARHPMKCRSCRSVLLRWDDRTLICPRCDRFGIPTAVNSVPAAA